jgi:hypothetical protein
MPNTPRAVKVIKISGNIAVQFKFNGSLSVARCTLFLVHSHELVSPYRAGH